MQSSPSTFPDTREGDGVQQYSTRQQLTALKQAWHSLYQRAEKRELCMSYEWLSNWVDIFLQPDDRLCIIAIFRQQQLALLAPLYLRPRNLNNQRHFTMQFLGTGEAEREEVTSEFQDILFDPQLLDKDSALDSLVAQIEKQPDWRYLEFRFCHHNALISQLLSRFSSASRLTRKIGCRYMTPIQEDWPATREQFPSENSRKNAQKALNRLNREQLRLEQATTPAEAAQQLNQLQHLHQLQWQEKGKAGAFSCSNFIRFHQLFTRDAFTRSWLHITQLVDTSTNSVIAVIYCIEIDNSRYYYQSGYDSNYSKLSPITMLHVAQMQDMLSGPGGEYEWMTGRNDSYKKGYASQQSDVFHHLLIRHRFSNLVSLLLEKGRHWKSKLQGEL